MSLTAAINRSDAPSGSGTGEPPHGRARGAEAFRPRSIAAYPLPGAELLAWNKAHWPLLTSDAVLLIHDVQNHWADMFAEPRPWLENIAALRQACDAADVPCIYTTARRARNTAERGLSLTLWGMGVGAGTPDPAAADVVALLEPRGFDFVIDKPKYSAFFDTGLEALLRRLGRRQLIVAGVFGHHGVMLTAADAYMRNLQVLLAVDAIADYSLPEHLMTARYVAEVCGCLVTTAQAVSELAARPTARA
jgi:bifunctional isochorismate lyase / aryl carrier protein